MRRRSADIVNLAEKHGAMVMVDEAHATGVYEPSGAGLVAKLGLGDRVPIQMGTLGKALGGFGAYVAGSKALRELLINRCRSFIFTTSLPPAVMAMGMAAIDLVMREPERRQALWNNCERLRAGLKELGYSLGGSQSQILPLMVGDATACMRLSAEAARWGNLRPGNSPANGAGGNFTVAHHADGNPHARAHRPSAESFQGSRTGDEGRGSKIDDRGWKIEDRDRSSRRYELRRTQTVRSYLPLASVHSDAGMDGLRSRASSAKATAIISSMCRVGSIWTEFHRFGAMSMDIEKKS